MSLEQQIASLTQAIQSLESVIRAGANAAASTLAPAMAPAPAVAPAPAAIGFGATTPTATAAPGLTYEQVQTALAQKAQQLGNPQPVVAVMLKYIPPGAKPELASVPPQNYAALLGEINVLERAA